MATAARRLAICLGAIALSVSSFAATAEAGGSWMYPVEDHYDPGDVATMVGYFGGGSYGPVVDEPYFAYLSLTDVNGLKIGEQRLIGELVFTPVDGQMRASITFTVPADLVPGQYTLDYCTAGCVHKAGDLIGGSVAIGVDSAFPVTRGWPIDEPEIANLDDDQLVSLMGAERTARYVRSRLLDPAPTAAPVPSAIEPIGESGAANGVAGEANVATAAGVVGAADRPSSTMSSVAWSAFAVLAVGAVGLTGRQVLRRRSRDDR